MSSPSPAISKNEKKWIETLLSAKADSKGAEQREKILAGAGEEVDKNADQIRQGLTFEMEKLDKGAIAKMKKVLRMKNTMKSLDKNSDANKEIDTFSDLPELKSLTPVAREEAFKALKKVSQISQKARRELRDQLYEEGGYPTERRQRYETALAEFKKTKKVPEGYEKEKLLRFEKTAKRLNEELDTAVAEEVWTPLVRQGAVPENLVPDRYSKLMKTFAGASDAYQKRLEEYSKGLNKHSSLIAALGVSQTVVVQAAQLGASILDAVPGANGVKDGIELAMELLPIASGAVTNAAIQALEKKSAEEIINGVLQQVSTGVGDANLPDGIGPIITGSISAVISGDRAIRALIDRKPQSFLDALSSAVNSALSTAASATGNTMLTDLTPMVVGVIKNGGYTAALIKACKDGNKEDIKAAMSNLIQGMITSIDQAVDIAVNQEVGNQGEASTITTAVDLGTSSVSGLITAALQDGNKAQNFAAALGGIANTACTDYIQPPGLGASVGGLINSAMSSAGPQIIEGIKNKKPGDVLAALSDMAVQSLATASAGVDDPETAAALQDASTYLGQAIQEMGIANDLRKAIEEADPDGIDEVMKRFMQIIAQHVKSVVPKKDGKKEGDGEGVKKADSNEEDDATVEKLRKIIAEQDKVIKNKQAPEEDREKAIKLRAKAMDELAEQKEMTAELSKDQETFANLMGVGMAEEAGDPDDSGVAPPKLEKLILELQRDRKIFELIDALSSMPVSIAAHFFPAAGAVLDFKKFSFEVVKAVQHSRALLQWIDNAKDAKSAVSVQVHAMLNRVHMEKRQVVEHNIRAALALTAAIGHVVAMVGAHGAPVGVALAASARAGEAAVNLAKIGIDQAEMQIGWQNYKKALKDPRDRKQVRAAAQSNPTLAKYWLAWGALEDGDPIAKDALLDCGLTAAVLNDKDSNLAKVQQYMEEMFHEDPVILRAVPVKMDWYPSKPQLTLRSWAAFLSAAQKSADLAAGCGGQVSEAFLKMDNAEEAWKKSRQELTAAEKNFKKAVALKVKEDLAVEEAKAKIVVEEVAEAKKQGKKAASKEGEQPGRTPKQIAREARKSVDRKELAAAEEKQKQAKIDFRNAVSALKKTIASFKPLTKKGAPNEQMSEYLDALDAQCDLKLREINGVKVSLDLSEAA